MSQDTVQADAGSPSTEVPQNEVVDLLVVGGGPGGMAAACRGQELGLSVLMIDYDDLMKRIRDYGKDKLILPSFGGGDRMCFPKGGELVSALHFAPIDKDEMCRSWKEVAHGEGIDHRIGAELTGLERQGDGLLLARIWDHSGRCDASIQARYVALALGRGVPRRFDIPGNTEGIAFRLTDAEAYVGQPACVIGGGTSAAEAVIALSNAKVAAGDPSEVYWSYRGDKMPRVSKALAEAFFEAYVGNGNVRYYPRSEPTAVVTAEDRREYLSLRWDRRRMEGRPMETSHLEFPKEACIACIGEDIPETLLAEMGIHMATGGPRNRKRMVVNQYLETRLPNVFLVGDLLSQAYFETEDFDADPASFREVTHRGNIKSAMRDGVLVAQVIRQRLDGVGQVETGLEDAEDPPGASPGLGLAAATALESPAPSAVGQPDVAGQRIQQDWGAFLVRTLPGGVQETEIPVSEKGVTTIGRSGCDFSVPSDTLLAQRHASISSVEGAFFLRDDGSSTGVFLRLRPARKWPLEDGDVVRAGRQFLLFSQKEEGYRMTHFDASGREAGRHDLADGVVILGREAPDITLDAEDRSLSRRHLAVSVETGRLYVKDLKSANGTDYRVRHSVPMEHGDRFRVGSQLLTFYRRDDPALASAHSVSAPRASAPSASGASGLPVAASSEPAGASVSGSMTPGASEGASVSDQPGAAVVVFEGAGLSSVIDTNLSVCELAERDGVPITAECHSGICGSDPIRILSGRENLDGEAGDQERETLEDLCDLEPGDCRLACMVRAKGPVKVEIL
ncbi:MAG: FHA domain-containing protein [Deltaproteobacteria bacterium]|nr:FHA domain-containing protein [Deltaproteobacteria bacterium]